MRRILPASIMAGLALVAGCGRLIPDAPRPSWPDAPSRPSAPAPVGRADPGLIDAPIDGGTRARISRAAGQGLEACRATLEAAGVSFVPSPDRDNTETCFLRQAGVLVVDRGTVARLAPANPTMTCETALALSVWRRQSLEPAARELLGSDVVQIDHFGTYACRNVNGAATGRPSAHSRAAAIDVGGVRLRDGRRVTLTTDWHGDGPEARFLRRIRDDACRVFGMALSPDYNAAHADHLHLEPNQSFCR